VKEELKKRIQDSIARHQPRPKWQFIGLVTGRNILLAALLTLAVVALGLGIYETVDLRLWVAPPAPPGSPWRGMAFLPWEIILALGLMATGIYLILRHTGTLYRWPKWVLALMVVALLIVAGLAMMPWKTYRHFVRAPAACQVLRHPVPRGGLGQQVWGRALEVEETRMSLRDDRGGLWDVLFNEKTKYHGGHLVPSAPVMVDGISVAPFRLQAFGVRVFAEDEMDCVFGPPPIPNSSTNNHSGL
jgi:hypothetical protein